MQSRGLHPRQGASAPGPPPRTRLRLSAADRRSFHPPIQRRTACPAPLLLRVEQACLEGRDQLSERHVEAARHEDQRLERRRPAALLKLADVVPGHAGRVRKLLLRHPTTGTKLAHGERQGATLARQGINHARQPVRAQLTLPDVALGMMPKTQGMTTRIGVGVPETTRAAHHKPCDGSPAILPGAGRSAAVRSALPAL